MSSKNHEIRVKLSKEEKEKIERKAKEAGMKLSGFLRYLGLKSRISVTLEE